MDDADFEPIPNTAPGDTVVVRLHIFTLSAAYRLATDSTFFIQLAPGETPDDVLFKYDQRTAADPANVRIPKCFACQRFTTTCRERPCPAPMYRSPPPPPRTDAWTGLYLYVDGPYTATIVVNPGERSSDAVRRHNRDNATQARAHGYGGHICNTCDRPTVRCTMTPCDDPNYEQPVPA